MSPFMQQGENIMTAFPSKRLLSQDTMLAHRLNGKDLLPENGFPLRLVIPRMYAYKGVKWVERIVFTEKQEEGYWEKSGYPVDGSIPGLKG